jgi:DnaJ homolog subfamily C member 2
LYHPDKRESQGDDSKAIEGSQANTDLQNHLWLKI